ncbi:N-carbamoylputrescine amidase [Acinetobacter sp. neg1]|nr:N-carbamoylputrescine amidase [Acinetobacter sp. neg1]
MTGGTSGSPLDSVTHIIGGVTGGATGNPLGAVTGIIGGITGGTDGGPLGAVTNIIGGITGGAGGNPLGAVTGIIGGITGGTEGGPLGAVTNIIGGITGGDLGNNPVTGVIQTGIDVLQGLESLKTEVINTGIDTVANTIIGAVHQSEHPIGDLADLGTLTFETSRDTVNGTLEAISDLAGADIGGAAGSLTGVVGTLITNGSTASGLVQHIAGDLTNAGGIIGGGDGGPLGAITGIIGGITGGIGGGEGGPLGAITGIIGGITGGIGGGEGGPLGAITGIIGGITGGIGGGEGGPLGAITGIIGGITGGDLGNNPVTGVIQTGIDVLQGVESLKTDIINTGISTVGGAIGSVLPGVHPVTDLTNLGTLTFETSRDTVNGTLEAISDLAGADIGGAAGSLTGVVGTLITNGSTASGLVQHVVGDLTDVGGLLGGITGGIGGGEGGPLGAITGIIGGITGGIGGGEGGPLGSITDIIGGITGGIGGGEGGPLGSITDIIGGITGGIGGGEGGPLGSITDIIGGITGGIGGGEGGPLGSITDIIGGITGGIGGGEGGPLGSITDIIGSITGGIGGGVNSGDIISGIAQPIQTVISSGNVAVDTLQDHVSTLFGDGSLDSLNNLISISAGNGDYSIHGSVDGILDAITGTVSSSSGIAVGEPNPNGGSLTDLVSLQSSLDNLTDHLFSSVNHF